MPVAIVGNKVVLLDGKVATDAACCCSDCTVTRITLQVEFSGTVDPELSPSCCNFSCTKEKSWNCPEDFACGLNEISFGVPVNEGSLQFDTSDCIACLLDDPYTVPWGAIYAAVLIHPNSVEVFLDPSFHCGAAINDNRCGINIGDANFSVGDDSPAPGCPAGSYSWSDSVTVPGLAMSYAISLTVT